MISLSVKLLMKTGLEFKWTALINGSFKPLEYRFSLKIQASVSIASEDKRLNAKSAAIKPSLVIHEIQK